MLSSAFLLSFVGTDARLLECRGRLLRVVGLVCLVALLYLFVTSTQCPPREERLACAAARVE